MSWEQDCSPQVMTVIKSSLEPLKSKLWDNDQPGPTWPLEYTCDWDCFTAHKFFPLPSFLVYLKLMLMSVPQRWLKMGWVLTLLLPTVCPRQCNKPPFSALPHTSLHFF
jgi:hypothetical protein